MFPRRATRTLQSGPTVSRLILPFRPLPRSPTVTKVGSEKLKYFPYAPMFREDLVEKIRSAGLTGIKFTEPSHFKY